MKGDFIIALKYIQSLIDAKHINENLRFIVFVKRINEM